jgi:ribosome-binding protein aMBF1 (putative translation factor)
LFSASVLKRYISIERIQEIVARLLPVDDGLQSRDDPAVSEMRETVAEAFGKKLAAARDKAGLSQEELGHLSAVHRTAVSELELGHNVPGMDTVIRLAGALGIEPCELMADVRWTPPPRDPGGGNYREV